MQQIVIATTKLAGLSNLKFLVDEFLLRAIQFYVQLDSHF